MSHTAFLQAQSREYQNNATRLRELTVTLEHQQGIQASKVIPKQYQPKPLKTFDSSLMEEFSLQYKELFFKQLEKVVTNNTIKVKLLESMLASIITQTENYLSTLPLSTEETTILYNEFLSENKIEHHTPLPALQTKLQQKGVAITHPPATHSKRTRPKRKSTTPIPPSKKYSKPDPFLSQSPLHSPTIS